MARDTLTDRQARFVLEYLVDLNATQAVIRAGYSKSGARQEGARLLSNAGIAAAIQEQQDARAARTLVTADRVVREYARVAFSDLRRFTGWGPDGMRPVASSDLSEDDGAAVAEVSAAPGEFGPTLKFKLYDKVKALDALGRHLGLDPAKIVELSGKDGGAIAVTVFDLLKAAAEHEARGGGGP